MAGSRKLVIEILGNANNASKAFADVRSDSAKTEERLSNLSAGLTSFGAKAIAGGAIAIGGLKQLADSASNYGEAVSKATVILGKDSVKQLEDFADGAAESAGISKTAAMDAAGSFGALGKQAGLTGKPLADFSTRLVQLAGDLASFGNTSVEDALQAIQSGLSGEAEPLKRYNIFLTEAALKAEYLALTGEEVNGTLTQQQKVLATNSLLFKQGADAVGDFSRTSDGLAAQTKIAQANFENLKVELGQGLVPIFAKVVGGVGSVLEGFQALPEGVRGPLGAIAGFGAVGTVAVGALSMVAGQAIKFRDSFTTTTTTLVDGVDTQTRSLNKLGQAALLIGKVGTALAIADGIFMAINSATNATGRIEDALNRTLVASQQTGPAVLDAFSGLVNAEDLSLGILKLWTDNGTQIALGNERLQSSVEDTQAAFDKLKGTNPEVASATLDELQRVTDGLDRNSGQYKANQEFIDRNRESLGLQAEAAAMSADSASGLGTEFSGLAGQTQTATDAIQEHIDTLQAGTDPVFAAIRATWQNAEAKEKAAAAEAKLTELTNAGKFGSEEYAQAQQDLNKAHLDSTSSAVSQQSAMATLAQKMNDGSVSSAIFRQTLDQMVASGAISQSTANNMAAAFGLASDGAKTGAWNVAVLKGSADKLNGTNANVSVSANTSDAQAKLDSIGRSLAFIRSQGMTWYLSPGGGNGRATGGTVHAGQPYLVGERGPEIIVPGSGYVIPTRRLVDQPSGTSSSGGGAGVIVNVSAGVGDPVAIGRSVVEVLKAYERTSGTAWRN